MNKQSNSHLRIQELQSKLPDKSAVILSNPDNIDYFTGFKTLVPTEREALACISRHSSVLLHAPFSPPPVLPPDSELQLHSSCKPWALAQTVSKMSGNGVNKFFVDKDSLFVSEYEELLKIENIELLPQDEKIVWSTRMYKDEGEIYSIKQACQITKKALNSVSSQIKPGVSESFIRKILEAEIRKNDADIAFPTIVAFGKHSALPHYQPSDQVILQENQAVLIDFGTKFNGYCADMTRTWWVGEKPDDEFLKIKDAVDRAYGEVIELLNSSLSSNSQLKIADLDNAARSVISSEGYGDQFIHTTGHGLGLAIHEQPSVHSSNSIEFDERMAITVEPGIYLEGKFGYRYENTVVVEDGEVVELTE